MVKLVVMNGHPKNTRVKIRLEYMLKIQIPS